MRTKPFFLGFALASGLLIAVVATTNYLIDVSGVYRSGGNASYEANFAKALMEMPEGIIFERGSERLIKRELLRLREAECYVTGSSHEMTLSVNTAPQLKARCSSLLNLAVSGAGYEDALVALHALSDHGPGLVIVGIGHWFFKHNADSRWQDLAEEYQQARAHFLGYKPDHRQSNDGRLTNLVNGRYLLRNIETVGTGRPIGELGAVRSEKRTDKDAILLSDGSLEYSADYVRDSFPRKETVSCAGDAYKVSKPFVDASVIAQFESAISKTLASGKKVALLLMPYHPGVFQCGGDQQAALVETEAAARKIAANLGIPVWGGYSPSVHGLDGRDFYDSHHVDANSLKKLRLN